MPYNNRIVLACAGSGKTTSIVDEACADVGRRSALITYTINGAGELSKCAHQRHRHVPPFVTISTWYVFLLRHFVRPYQNCLYLPRVERINFNQEESARYIPATNIQGHYFSQPGTIYRDKVSKFACEVIRRTGGLPIRRFEKIFDCLFIDESQDLAGFDLELVEHLLKSCTDVVMVGDHRQATYTTNDARKNKRYARAKIVDKFEEWQSVSLCAVEYRTESHRCVQSICDFADLLYPNFPKTHSLNKVKTGHDGVFGVRPSHVGDYCARFDPQPLRYNRTFEVAGKPLNFGNAKGMTFERTLIYPHGPLRRFLNSAQLADAGKEIPKLYVAITRARQSVAFVVDDEILMPGVSMFEP
jgi:DNA helicase II / ATP-dependent DNA helicase PcrA